MFFYDWKLFLHENLRYITYTSKVYVALLALRANNNKCYTVIQLIRNTSYLIDFLALYYNKNNLFLKCYFISLQNYLNSTCVYKKKLNCLILLVPFLLFLTFHVNTKRHFYAKTHYIIVSHFIRLLFFNF